MLHHRRGDQHQRRLRHDALSLPVVAIGEAKGIDVSDISCDDERPSLTSSIDHRLPNLAAGAKAIDSGSNAQLPEDTPLDLGDEPRLVDDPDVDDSGIGTAPIVDMGAYERQL